MPLPAGAETSVTPADTPADRRAYSAPRATTPAARTATVSSGPPMPPWLHAASATAAPDRMDVAHPREAPDQLEDGVGAMSGPPSSSPQWPRRSTIRSTHPIGIGASHWAIRNSITAAVSCSVIPGPATLDRMPM